MKEIESSIGLAATKIAEDVKADCIVAMERYQEKGFEENIDLNTKIVIFKKIKPGMYSKQEFISKLKKTRGITMFPIKELIMEAINKR